MNENLITIVTVTYNAGDLLEETILSVIKQSYKHIEYIIIDGASTDKTIDIIKKYEDHIDYWISEPDDGIYYAMNKAIEKADGEWINFMNSGDTFTDTNTVEYVMQNKSEDAELIYGNYRRKSANTPVKAKEKIDWYKSMPLCHQTLFTKTELMKQNMFDTRYKLAGDHNFVIKMFEENRNFCYIDKTIAIYLEGGFAQSTPLLASVESLYILLHSNAPQNDIKASWWFKLLKANMSADKARELESKENEITKLIKDKRNFQKSIKELISIKFIFHPIKKYRQYKRLVKIYYSLK